MFFSFAYILHVLPKKETHHISERGWILRPWEIKTEIGNCHFSNPCQLHHRFPFQWHRVLMTQFLDCKLMENSGLCLTWELFHKELCSGKKCDGVARAPVCLWCGSWWQWPQRSSKTHKAFLHQVSPFPFSIPDLLFLKYNYKTSGERVINDKWLLQHFTTWNGNRISPATFSKYLIYSAEWWNALRTLQRQSCGSWVLCLNSRKGENRC